MKDNKHLYKFVNGKRVRVLKDKECPVCNQTFSPRVSKAKYCSRKCYYEMKRIRGDRVNWTPEMRKRMSNLHRGKGNPMYGKDSWCKGKKRPEITGDKHPNWKGGYWISEDGYKVLQNNLETDGKKISEHKKILEEKIGRKLEENEVTHHINGNKLDNRPENLEVMTRAEHINEHREQISGAFKDKLE